MLIGDWYYLSDMPLSTFMLNRALIFLELYAICLLSGFIHVRQIKKACKHGKMTLQEVRKEIQNVKNALLTLTLLTLVADSLLVITALTI
jgi:hypothetical protein